MAATVPSWPRVELTIKGASERFPVRRVFCVGRNYAEHAKEMGHDAREPPFFFGKAPEALSDADEVPYPPATRDLHHEVELVVALGDGGRDLKPEATTGLIWGYAVGVDLTRRDLQAEAKRLARPWHLAKSFVGAAPIGPLRSADEIGHPRRGAIWLDVAGKRRQTGDLAEMVWSVEEVLAHLSQLDTLLPGDLIFTGTPAGVGPVQPGEPVTAGVDGVGELAFTMVRGA